MDKRVPSIEKDLFRRFALVFAVRTPISVKKNKKPFWNKWEMSMNYGKTIFPISQNIPIAFLFLLKPWKIINLDSSISFSTCRKRSVSLQEDLNCFCKQSIKFDLSNRWIKINCCWSEKEDSFWTALRLLVKNQSWTIPVVNN